MQNIDQIRKNEMLSHRQMYSSTELYSGVGWLQRPIKTVLDIIPLFSEYENLRVLDLGCGVGRNCIPFAQQYNSIPCIIEGVDILDLAIEKLSQNAEKFGVEGSICGFVRAIEDYPIKENHYDLIMAVSALEHIDSEVSFINKLYEIERGTRRGGIVCLVINSDVTERDVNTGDILPPQFEVNLSTEALQKVLTDVFSDWSVLKNTVSKQCYETPRGDITAELQTNVVTLVARKNDNNFR